MPTGWTEFHSMGSTVPECDVPGAISVNCVKRRAHQVGPSRRPRGPLRALLPVAMSHVAAMGSVAEDVLSRGIFPQASPGLCYRCYTYGTPISFGNFGTIPTLVRQQ